MSEFTILRGIFAAGNFSLGISFIALLALIFIGMSSTVITVTLGPPMEEEPSPDAVKETFMTVLSPLLLMAVVLVLGIYVPEPLRVLFQEAAELVGGGQGVPFLSITAKNWRLPICGHCHNRIKR